jgi:hypothetical protein
MYLDSKVKRKKKKHGTQKKRKAKKERVEVKTDDPKKSTAP